MRNVTRSQYDTIFDYCIYNEASNNEKIQKHKKCYKKKEYLD